MPNADDELRLAQAALLADVLQRVGYALWQAAECEDTLAHYLVVRVQATRGMGEGLGIELLRKAQRRTFGQVLRGLQDKGVVDDAIEVRLTHLLNERNWLVHHSKRENRGVLSNLKALDALVERLSFIGEEATELNGLLVACN